LKVIKLQVLLIKERREKRAHKREKAFQEREREEVKVYSFYIELGNIISFRCSIKINYKPMK